jgi:hypothetical protein
VLDAAEAAIALNGWLVAEESLGVTGAGDLALITSPIEYRCAAGKRSALAAKVASAQKSPQLLCVPNVPSGGHPNAIYLDDVIAVSGDQCTIKAAGRSGSFTNPLLALPGYRVPLALAGTAALLLGQDPAPLSTFPGVPGRMEVRKEQGIVMIDNANSGTNAETTIEAVRYARACSGSPEITLVIGTVNGDGAVCEGFSEKQILSAIRAARPRTLIWVGDPPERGGNPDLPAIDAICQNLKEAERRALERTHTGAIVLAVKTWR